VGHEERDCYGNPLDFDEYLRKLEGPERESWQKPEEVLAALDLRSGHTVCDVGCGPGYFTLRIAPRVRHVFAIEVEPKLLLRAVQRIESSGARNVTPVLALPGDPLLPPDSRIDVALVVNTYHHFPDGPDYLHKLASSLSPEGRIAIVEFREHKTSREQCMRDGEAASLRLVAEHEFLADQFFLVLRKK
jgi:cyclopropane fatty-acyl-phospholipid synthase-like methyltransferase